MALEAAFRDLNAQLGLLRERLVEVQLTVSEDQPGRTRSHHDRHTLIVQIGNALTDVHALVEEAIPAVIRAQEAVDYPVDIERARRALVQVHERQNRLARHFAAELVSYRRIDQLNRFGRERDAEWAAWVSSVKEGLERCQAPLYGVHEALFRCWQEMAERAGMNSVSVQATNIGQQITVSDTKRVIEEEESTG